MGSSSGSVPLVSICGGKYPPIIETGRESARALPVLVTGDSWTTAADTGDDDVGSVET